MMNTVTKRSENDHTMMPENEIAGETHRHSTSSDLLDRRLVLTFQFLLRNHHKQHYFITQSEQHAA